MTGLGVVLARVAYGRQSEAAAPLLFANDSLLLYSLGRSLARLDIHTNEVSFLPFPSQPATLTAAACSPKGKHLAVSASSDAATNHDQKICVYDLDTGLLKSTMYVEASFTRGSTIKHLAFSADGVCLAAMCEAASTSLLACWQWSSRHFLASVNCGMVAHSLAAHPSDPKQWTVCGARFIAAYCLCDGDQSFTRLTIKIGGERQFSAQAWLHDEVLAVCSLKGEVVIIKDAEQRVLMKLHTPLHCIAPVGKGFAVGSNAAALRFRAVDVNVRDDKENTWYIQDSSHACSSPVLRLTVSPNSKTVLAGVATGQLTAVDLRLAEADCTHSPPPLSPLEGGMDQDGLPQSLYNSPVQGRPISLDAVSLRPIMGILDEDGWVSLLDYRSSRTLLQQQLIGRPTCLALHPLGMMLAVGSAEKLTFFYILSDGLHMAAELPLKRCSKVRFNNGGNRLAVCAGRNVAIFSTVSMQQEKLLQGHLTEVADVCWTRDDTRLVSVGGSNLYHWSNATWQRLPDQDFCDKQLKFCQLALLDQPELTAIVQCTTGQVMAVRKGLAVKQVHEHIPQDAIIRAADHGNVLLHTSALGAVTSTAQHLRPDRQEGQPSRQSLTASAAAEPGAALPRHAWLHRGSILHMRVLQSSGLLFSVDAQGVLIVSKLPWPTDAVMEPEWPDCSLVTDAHMQAVQLRMRDLQMVADSAQRVSEFEVLQASKALELERMRMSERMRQQELEVQRQQQDMAHEKKRAEAKWRKALAAEAAAHGHDLNLLEGGLLQRVQEEQRRFKAASSSHAAEVKAREARMQQMQALHASMLTEVTAAHESALAMAQAKHAQGQAVIEQLKAAHVEEVSQCDAEYEEAFLTRRAQAVKEKEVSERTEAKLRAKLHLLKSANHRLQNEKTAEADKATEHAAAATSLQKLVKELEDDVKDLQGDIKTRDGVIASDYRALHSQRARITNLESHNFVLDHRAQDLRRTFKEHTTEVTKLQRQVDSLRIKHISESEKAQALASSLDMQRNRVHSVLAEMAEAKGRADKAQEAIASAHPLVTSLLVQTSLTAQERQQLCLTLAATLGVQNLPPFVCALTTQPSIFRQHSTALASPGSAFGLSSPLPPWNVSSPRRPGPQKSGRLSRSSSVAPSVSQSPRDNVRLRSRLAQAPSLPDALPEHVQDPYPEQLQPAVKSPVPLPAAPCNNSALESAEAELRASEELPKPGVRRPPRQLQTIGTQTATQQAAQAPPQLAASDVSPQPEKAQRRAAFKDIKVDVTLAGEPEKGEADVTRAAEYEQAVRKAQEQQHAAEVAEARVANLEKELARADKRAKAEIRRRTDENSDLLQELQSLQEANQQLTEEVTASAAALKVASRQQTPRELAALAPPLPSARSRQRRPASPTTPSHSQRPTPRALLSARSRTSHPVSPPASPKPASQRRLSKSGSSRKSKDQASKLAATPALSACSPVRGAEVLEVHSSPAINKGARQPHAGSPESLPASRSTPIVMPLRLGALLRRESDSAARQEQELLDHLQQSPRRQQGMRTSRPTSPDADMTRPRTQETQGSRSARSTVQRTPRNLGSAPATPQYQEAAAGRGSAEFWRASGDEEPPQGTGCFDSTAYASVPQLSEIPEASWEGSRAMAAPLQQPQTQHVQDYGRPPAEADLYVPGGETGLTPWPAGVIGGSSPRSAHRFIQAPVNASAGYFGAYTMKAMRGATHSRPTSSGGLGSRGSPRRKIPFAG